MKNAIVILTRLYIDKDKKEDKGNDEFRAVQCPDSDNFKLIRTLEIDVLILHGHNKRFVSTNPFRELAAEVTQLLGTQKAYMFYHLGNETMIAELPKVSTVNDENPFIDSISYTIGGGGEPRTRGKVVADLYKAINADDNQKANECVREILKSFQQKTNSQFIFSYINALCNIPYKNNLDEVVEMLSADIRITGLKIDEVTIIDYVSINYHNPEIMKEVARYLKQQLQTN